MGAPSGCRGPRSDAEVRLAHRGGALKFAGGALPDHLPVGQDVDEVRRIGGEAVVLLDQEDRQAAAAQVGHDLADPLDDHRRQALRRLVHQEQAGVGQQGAADREHLLLASGELATPVAPAILEVGEQVVEPFERPRAAACRAASREREVLLDGERGEDAAPLGDQGQSPLGNLEGLLAHELLVVERDPAGARPDKPHDGVDQGRLAHAVAPEEDSAGPVTDPQVHPLQDVVDPPVGMQVANLDHGLPPAPGLLPGRGPPGPAWPRYSSRTRSSSCTCRMEPWVTSAHRCSTAAESTPPRRTSMSCSIMTRVSSAGSDLSSAWMSTRSAGDSPAAGSSSSSTRGLSARASSTSSSRTSPWDSSEAVAPSRVASPNPAASSAASAVTPR